MYFWSTCVSKCLGKKQTIMSWHQPKVTLCVLLLCSSRPPRKNNSSLICWITALPDQSFVEFRRPIWEKASFKNFVLSFYLRSISDGELFVPIGELLRDSDLPFLGLRILDLLLWLQAVGQLSNHSAVLLTLQKFPSAYSVWSVNLGIDSHAAEI